MHDMQADELWVITTKSMGYKIQIISPVVREFVEIEKSFFSIQIWLPFHYKWSNDISNVFSVHSTLLFRSQVFIFV